MNDDILDTGGAVADFLSSQTADVAQQARVSMGAAVNAKPDFEARIRDQAAAAGVPLSSARAMPEEVNRRATLQGLDFDDMAQRLPSTMQFLADQENAKLAHDDVPSLSALETAMRGATWAAQYAFSHPSASRTLAGDLGTGAREVASGLPQLASGIYGLLETGVKTIAPIGDPLAGTILPENPLRRLAAGLEEGRRGQAAYAERIAGELPADAGVIRRGVRSGLQSIGQQAPAMVASMVTGNPTFALASAGAATGGQSAGKALDKGLSPAAALIYGAGDAAVEVGTELSPMVRLLGDMKAGSGLMKTLLRQVATEAPGEQVATVLQDLNEWAVLNPEKPFRDYLVARPGAAAETLVATIVGVGVQSGAAQVAGRAMGMADQKVATAADAVNLEAVMQAATQSKLRERDPQAFADLVQQTAESTGAAPALFFIDAKVLTETLAQSGITLEQASAAMPSLGAQVEEAVRTGGDVAIPVGELAAGLPGSPLEQALLQHLRSAPDSMSQAEAEAFQEEQGDAIRGQVEQALGRQEEATAHQQAVDQVQVTFEAELASANRFTPDVNKAYASLLASFYGAQALRVGTTPDALLQKYGLKVQAQSPLDGGTFNQADNAAMPASEKPGPIGEQRTGADQGNAVTEADMPQEREGHTRLYHGGTGEFSEVPKGGAFDGFFASGNTESSWGAHGSGANYFADVPDEKILTNYALNYEIPYEEVAGALRKELNGLEESDFDVAWAAVIEEDNVYEMDEEQVLRIFSATDLSEASWEEQRIRGSVARRLGFSAVEMSDEHGTSYLIAPGTPLTRVKPNEATASESPDVFNQGAGDRASISFASDITTTPSVIALLKGADLTSFIHESGHFFLEVQADLARRIQQQVEEGASVTEAERGIVADMDTLFGWFGVQGGPAEWDRMSVDERRESHEKFARGFEAFAFEGTSPSLALKAVFQRFRSWLANVYKTLRNLNVELTDDVRAVMGRMLASEQAIEEAEAQRGMGALFKDAEKAGMTLEEFQAYQGTASAATASAVDELQTRGLRDMKWLSNARSKALKARQAEVEDLRRGIRREVTAETMSQPVYRAWQFLTGKADAVEAVTPGRTVVDDIDTTIQKGKLRTSLLKDLAPEQWEVLSKRRMTSEDKGMHPEIVAEIFGFDSADALVQQLAAAQPPREVIAALVDQRMLERHGDISSEEALARAADESVHNQARARFIATELKALEAANQVREDAGSTRAGRRQTVDVLARAAREYATEIIDRLKVRDIRPAQYAAAEVRNSKAAEKAFAAGKTEEAAQHKRNQLVNNFATKAAYDAQDEVKAAVKYFRRFDKRSKTIDPGYIDQIDALLDRFDLGNTSLRAVDKRKSLLAWVEAQREQGIEPSIPEELLDDANRKSWKDMTVEELRGLRDTVQQIEHLGRLKNKLLLTRDKRDFDAAAETMAASIVEHGGPVRPVALEGPNPVTDWFAGVAAQHRKLASLFRQMDGNQDSGPMYDLIGRAMNERGTMEDVMVEKATMALRALYAPVEKLKGGLTGARSKLFIPEINASLTRGGRLAVALNWGNDANRQRIMDGDKWSEGQVRAILKTLTRTELEFVNGVWEYIDSFWPEVSAKEKRLTGVVPEKVEASPFVVVAADGTDVAMRGGYYPLKYDTDRSDRADTQEAAQAAKEMMQGAFTRATTRRGHTKERLQEVKRAVRKDLNVLTQHVTQVTHDLAWHEWLIDTNRLLADHRVVSAIRDHYGPRVLKTMRDNVMGIATADVAPQTSIDKAMLVVRSNVTRATMGASLTTAFLQPFGLTQSMVRIGPKHVLRGLARWGGDAARMENSVSWIREKSEFMRLRAKTLNKELREIRGTVAGKSRTMTVVDAGLFALMQKMQMVADVPTWIGQYEKSLAEGLDEAAAVAMADRMVLESQGGGQTKDLAEVQRKHPMLTQFYSYFSVTLNLAAEQTAATDFKSPAAVAGWLGDMALLMIIPAIVPSMLLFALKGGDGDDEKGWAKRMAEWQLGYLLGTVVGLRELSGVVGGFDYAGPPVGRLIGDIGKAGKQIGQGDLDEPAVLAIVNLLGSAFGIPTVQALRSYKGWKAWSDGVEGAGPQSVLFGPPPK